MPPRVASITTGRQEVTRLSERACGFVAARLVVSIGVGSSACAQVTGIDEYAVGCGPGEIVDEGKCVAVPDCGPDEVPVLGGDPPCRRAGVDCTFDGFEPDPDVPGGCRARVGECERLIGELGNLSCLYACRLSVKDAGSAWLSSRVGPAGFMRFSECQAHASRVA